MERVTIKPSVGFFNVANFANFDLPNNMMSGLLTGAHGTINGTNYAGHLRQSGRRGHRSLQAGFASRG